MRHILIRIEELEMLTDRELDELEARLRCILQTDPGLTDDERTFIAISLGHIQHAYLRRRSLAPTTGAI